MPWHAYSHRWTRFSTKPGGVVEIQTTQKRAEEVVPVPMLTPLASPSRTEREAKSTTERSSPRTVAIQSVEAAKRQSPSHEQQEGLQFPTHPAKTKRYLVLCFSSGAHRMAVRNIDLTNVHHDEILFRKAREAYDEAKAAQFRNPFIVARTIHYVRIELLYLHHTGESVGNRELDSIPAIEDVYSGDYSYRPCPPDIGRYPIHPDIFMHSFKDPGDHTGSVAVARLPKKMRRPLTCANDSLNIPTGWGIYIVEGLNWPLVGIVISLLMLVTAGIALAWSVVQKDVQGGTGIGSLIAALTDVIVSVIFIVNQD
ncbi:unnamed protein product [Parascedosporium putredinis]|uniref:Uncharacterized protein n=1 Tax=Parascedosporium putredinis TaxID=1442378 RepID=A0A9P1MAH2_9PEZI|nr:unnamed protein product [Parascedosporium putredinis]CAI7994126.1 unnamed protein product [Parascedosporium putredinis]